jgi:prepilin-type N-terminal cleavage/methylation domain-containing protein
MRGMTLIEVILAAAVLAVLVLTVYALLHGVTHTELTGRALSTIEQNGMRVLEQVVEELRGSTLSSVAVSNSNEVYTLRFKKAIGLDTQGGYLESDTIEYTGALEAGETDDGKDNDGDGLVDEYVLVRRVKNSSGAVTETRTVCRQLRKSQLQDGTPFKGFHASRASSAVTIRLTLQAADSKNRILERTLSTSVTPRN